MRVSFVLAHLTRGGPVEHTLSLAEEMSRAGVEVGAVCATAGIAARFRSAGVEACEIPLVRSLDPKGARRIWRYVRGADVVHAQDRRSGLWVRLGPRPRSGGARVYTVHGLPDEYLPPPAGNAAPGIRGTVAYRGLDAALCRRADAVVVPSRAIEHVLVERLRFPPARMVVIPGGVEPPASTAERPGERVGTLTVLDPVKGLDVFLRAAARLASERPGLRFGVMGAGPEAANLRALAASLGIAGKVEFPGHLPRREALDRLSVFVLSSWMENCPMALLEAMAAGVPVVATDVGGVPEIATVQTAQLVPPGDDVSLAAAIGRLLDDPELRERQRRAARERVVSRFTAERAARETIALYERILGTL
jgi:glycosyltransferase involved in cell wall biosynthesis